MSIFCDHSKSSFPLDHIPKCSTFLMLVSQKLCEESLEFNDRKRRRKKKGKLFFSTRKELLRSRKRALTVSSTREESLLECTCNLKEIHDNVVETVKEGSPEKTQWTWEERLRLHSPSTTLNPYVSKSLHV